MGEITAVWRAVETYLHLWVFNRHYGKARGGKHAYRDVNKYRSRTQGVEM